MNKILIIALLSAIILMGLGSSDLGSFKQGECVNIRVLSNESAINLSTITIGSNTTVLNIEMENLVGQTFNYSYCDTEVLGTYVYDWYPCSNLECVNSFDITPSGNSGNNNTWFFIFVIVLIYAITFIAFFGKNEAITIMGGMAMIGLGVYIINNGLIVYRDWLTNYVAYITLGLGAIMALWAIIELLQE